MLVEHAIREQVERLRSGEIDVYAFDEWLDEASWGMHRNGSLPSAVALAESIHELYSASHFGEISREELRERILELAARAPVEVAWQMASNVYFDRPVVMTSSSRVQLASSQLRVAV